MHATQPADRGDVRAVYINQVFLHLSRSILSEETDSSKAAERLWRLPEVTVRFVCNAVTEAERRELEPTIHRLRQLVATLIDEKLDLSGAKSDLSDRITAARQEIRFRPWNADDAPVLATLLNSERLWAGLPDESPGHVDEHLANQLIAIANGWSIRHWVQAVEWRGELIGQVRLQFDSTSLIDSAEISYWLGERFWGRGLGSRIVTLFTADSFQRWPQIRRIFATVLSQNVASRRVLENAGYHYETFLYRNVTKAAAQHSTHVLGVSREDYALSPAAAGSNLEAVREPAGSAEAAAETAPRPHGRGIRGLAGCVLPFALSLENAGVFVGLVA